MKSCASYAANYRDSQAVANLRRHLDRFLKVRPLFAKDFYPLTEWTINPKEWLAFQFHDPATGKGIVQAFCGPKAARSHRVRLKGLQQQQNYRLTNWDNEDGPTEYGRELLLNERIELSAAPDAETAIVIEYEAVE